jgi:uncharacterized protein YdeI (YjbR/CyaY-like superfamily)
LTPEEKITPGDLASAMAAADVLDSFRQLPEDARRDFERWIAKARDGEAHWRRINTLVMAMRSAPRLQAVMSKEQGPASTPGEPVPQRGSAEVEEVLNALGGPGTLDLLGMTTDELHAARTDSDVFETLRITHELLVILRDEKVLSTFWSLPKDEQRSFVRRLGATDDEGLRRGRTETFVSALRESPLANGERYGDAEYGDRGSSP